MRLPIDKKRMKLSAHDYPECVDDVALVPQHFPNEFIRNVCCNGPDPIHIDARSLT